MNGMVKLKNLYKLISKMEAVVTMKRSGALKIKKEVIKVESVFTLEEYGLWSES